MASPSPAPPTSSSASSAAPPTTPAPAPLVVLRVKRRRTEDPVEAFKVQAKRSRPTDASPDGASATSSDSCHFRLLDTVETASDASSIAEAIRERQALERMEKGKQQGGEARRDRLNTQQKKIDMASARAKEKNKDEIAKKRAQKRFALVESLRTEDELPSIDIPDLFGASTIKGRYPRLAASTALKILDFQEIFGAGEGEFAGPLPTFPGTEKKDEMTMNGTKLERIGAGADYTSELSNILEHDFVYDLYYRPGAVGAGGTGGASDQALQEVVEEISGEMVLIPDVDYSDYYNPASDAFRLRTGTENRDFDEDPGNASDDSNSEAYFGNDYPDEEEDDDYQYDGEEYVDFSLDGLKLGDEVLSSETSSDNDDGGEQLGSDFVYSRTADMHGGACAEYKRKLLKEMGEEDFGGGAKAHKEDEEDEDSTDIDEVDEF